jgi:hypothetical protein
MGSYSGKKRTNICRIFFLRREETPTLIRVKKKLAKLACATFENFFRPKKWPEKAIQSNHEN